MPGVRCHVPGAGAMCLMPGVRCQVSGVKCQVLKGGAGNFSHLEMTDKFHKHQPPHIQLDALSIYDIFWMILDHNNQSLKDSRLCFSHSHITSRKTMFSTDGGTINQKRAISSCLSPPLHRLLCRESSGALGQDGGVGDAPYLLVLHNDT